MNKRSRVLLVGCAILILCTGALSAQTTASTGSAPSDSRSQLAQWRDILRYGIDSEILEILPRIREQRETSLNAELVAIATVTLNPTIFQTVTEYLSSIECRDADAVCLEKLADFDEQNRAIVIASINSLRLAENADLLPFAREHFNDRDRGIADACLRALGALGSRAEVDLLLEELDTGELDDITGPPVIAALGELGDAAASEELAAILEDTANSSGWRLAACEALGRIGDPASLPVLEGVFADENSYLRAAAVGALRHYPLDRVFDALVQALRDSFWRVRVAAAEGLARREASSALSILIYKARRDPEVPVRSAAIRAIGVIGNAEAYDFLRAYFAETTTVLAIKELCLTILLEQDAAATLPLVREQIEAQWNIRNSLLLEMMARLLSLAGSETPSGASANSAESGNVRTPFPSALAAPLFERFLSHPSTTIQIYGLRGIGRNGLVQFRAAVETLSAESMPEAVRRSALSTLEQIGSP